MLKHPGCPADRGVVHHREEGHVAAPRVIGLDIGTSAVRAAELALTPPSKRSRSTATLTRFGSVALPPGAVRDGEVAEPEIVAGALKRLWAEQRFASKEVVIGVGNQRVVVRELDLPWMPPDQVRAALPFQVQELLPMPIDEALLDFFPTGQTDGPQGQMMHGMLVAAQRDTVRANVMAVESAGLRPLMVDLSAFALMRALVRGDYADRVVGLVEIGASTTQVVVAAHGVPRLVRTIPLGGEQVTTALAQRLSIATPEAEALKREAGLGFVSPPELRDAGDVISSVVNGLVEAVRNTFVYYQGNNPGAGIEGVLLTGGGAHLPGLGQFLASASRLPVAYGDVLADVRLDKAVAPRIGEGMGTLVAMSIGLAYGAAA
nr:type IV pilus assembly protein PilM [Cellulomonas hominis]